MALTAELMVQCALARKESRGLHYNVDYPDMADEANNTILTATPNTQYPASQTTQLSR